MLAYMVEVVIVDLVAMFSILHGKVVARTDKEEVTDNISNHFLVEVSVINVFPISILREYLSKIILSTKMLPEIL